MNFVFYNYMYSLHYTQFYTHLHLFCTLFHGDDVDINPVIDKFIEYFNSNVLGALFKTWKILAINYSTKIVGDLMIVEFSLLNRVDSSQALYKFRCHLYYENIITTTCMLIPNDGIPIVV